MRIGVPKESMAGERRVALVPDIVFRLVKLKIEVAVERNAGRQAGFTDGAYEKAGAQLVGAKEAFAADLVFKGQRPQAEEIPLLNQGAILVSLLPVSTSQDAIARL